MTAIVVSHGAIDPFDAVLRKAGAVFTNHDGHPVPVSYGSAAAELAVCVAAVGLVDRSEMTKLVLEAPPAQLEHLMARLTGGSVAVGGALYAAGAWWCGSSPGRVVVLCEPFLGARLRERLRTHALHHVTLTVHDRSEDWVAIELIGAATSRLLTALHAYGETGDPRLVAPFSAGTVAAVEVSWLLESSRSALVLAPREHAAEVWLAIEDAGRPLHISCVGQEAASRYRLLQRASR